MPITIYIEIAIGIVFVWLFLSLAVMAIQEWIDAIFKTRARELQNILRGMLEDPKAFADASATVTSIVDQIYDHPSIRSLQQPLKARKQKGNGETGLLKRTLTSYIPPRTFALTLFDIIVTAGTSESVLNEALEDWEREARNIATSLRETGTMPPDVKDALEPLISDVVTLTQSAKSHSEVVGKLNAKLQVLKDQYPAGVAVLDPIIQELPQYLLSAEVVKGIANLAGKDSGTAKMLNDLKKKAFDLAAQGQDLVSAFRTSTETWFNDTMDRAGGWYKRRAQLLAFVFGVIVAIVLNVDSLAVVTHIYRDPTIRSTLVAQAEALDDLPENSADVADELKGLDDRLRSLGLPVGWKNLKREQCDTITASGSGVAVQIGALCVVPGELPEGIPASETPWGYVAFGGKKLFGWLFSGAMAAQGAPLWFDILRKLVNVRSAGKKPESSEDKTQGT